MQKRENMPVWHRVQLRRGGSAKVAPRSSDLDGLSSVTPHAAGKPEINLKPKRGMRRRSNSLPARAPPSPTTASAKPAFERARSMNTHRMSRVTDVVYIGDRDDAYHLAGLHSNGITHILNCASCQVPRHHGKQFAYMGVPVFDSPETDLMPYFDRTCDFLRRCKRAGGCALVHCIAGVARSVSFTIAHLMANENMRLRQAYNLVKKKRPIMCPNASFRFQLAKFEIQLFGDSSVADSTDKAWNIYEWNLIKRGVTVHKPLEGIQDIRDLECCALS